VQGRLEDEASLHVCAIIAPSAKRAGKGFILAALTDQIERFPPSFVQSVDTTGRVVQRIP